MPPVLPRKRIAHLSTSEGCNAEGFQPGYDCLGSDSEVGRREHDFRSSPRSRHRSTTWLQRKRFDAVKSVKAFVVVDYT